MCILSTIGVFAAEEDVGTYTIKAVDDPRTLNKILYLRPPSNILSHNELVSLWERKVGQTIERVYIPEDEVLKKIQGHSKGSFSSLGRLVAARNYYFCFFPKNVCSNFFS